MEKYAFAVTLTQNEVIHLAMAVIEASSLDEAGGIARRVASKTFPPESGWEIEVINVISCNTSPLLVGESDSFDTYIAEKY